MKVIISWSGDRSKAIAEALRDWLQFVVHAAEAWTSDQDIGKGSIWPEKLMEQLKVASYGILCITPENQHKEWISFEAGTLAAKFGPSNACPLLYGLEKGQLTGPLSLFQATVLQKDDFKKLVKEMNTLARNKGERVLDDGPFDSAFEKMWPDLEAKLTKIPAPKEKVQQDRDPKDVMNEILLTVRSLAQGVALTTEERARIGMVVARRTNSAGIPVRLLMKLEEMDMRAAAARIAAAGAPSFYACPKCGGTMKLGVIPGSSQGVYVCEKCSNIERINPEMLESNNPTFEESDLDEPKEKPKKE